MHPRSSHDPPHTTSLLTKLVSHTALNAQPQHIRLIGMLGLTPSGNMLIWKAVWPSGGSGLGGSRWRCSSGAGGGGPAALVAYGVAGVVRMSSACCALADVKRAKRSARAGRRAARRKSAPPLRRLADGRCEDDMLRCVMRCGERSEEREAADVKHASMQRRSEDREERRVPITQEISRSSGAPPPPRFQACSSPRAPCLRFRLSLHLKSLLTLKSSAYLTIQQLTRVTEPQSDEHQLAKLRLARAAANGPSEHPSNSRETDPSCMRCQQFHQALVC